MTMSDPSWPDPRKPLPRDQCDRCGAVIIWVLREGRLDSPMPIDDAVFDMANPLAIWARVPQAEADGRVNVVREVPENERWMHERMYVSHNRTCPQADKRGLTRRKTLAHAVKMGRSTSGNADSGRRRELDGRPEPGPS